MNATTKKKPRHTVPNGIYPATLQDYQLVNTKNGMRYQFIFSLDGMKTKDGMPVTLMRTTSPSMAHKSHRREIVEALQRSEFEGVKDLFGNPAADKESLPAELINTLLDDVNAVELIGVPCNVHVENQKNKAGITYSNIETVFPKYNQ